METCCPRADNPMIKLDLHHKKLQLALRLIYFGEIGASIARANLFGFMSGVLHLISVWIDYMGYATMHFCQIMVITFCGGIEALMLVMNLRDGGMMQSFIYESKMSLIVFWTLLAFSVGKCVCTMSIYNAVR